MNEDPLTKKCFVLLMTKDIDNRYIYPLIIYFYYDNFIKDFRNVFI